MVTLETVRGYGRVRRVLNEEHWLLLKMFANEPISENQSQHSVYTALYSVSKYLKYLKDKGKSINDATPMDLKVYLATKTKDST